MISILYLTLYGAAEPLRGAPYKFVWWWRWWGCFA